MKRSLTFSIFAFLISILLFSTANSNQYFTAFEGIDAAKDTVISHAFTDAKLIYISSYGIGAKSLNGSLDRWLYVFAHNKISNCAYISVQKNSDQFVAQFIMDKPSDRLYMTNDANRTLNDFSEITKELINSDSYCYLQSRPEQKFPFLPDNLSPYEFNLSLYSIKNAEYFHFINDTTGTNFLWRISSSSMFFDSSMASWRSMGGTTWVSANNHLILSQILLTGVPEINEVSEISVSPNPATDFLEISIGTNGVRQEQNIEIFSVYGEKVLNVRAKGTSPLQIDVSSLPQGIYFVKVGAQVVKFVKI